MGSMSVRSLGAVAVMIAGCGGPPAAVMPSVATAPAPAPAPAPASASATATATPTSTSTSTPTSTATPPSSFTEDVPAPPPSPAPTITLSTPRKDELLDATKAPDHDVRFKLSNWKIEAGKSVELVLDDRASLVVDDPSRPVHIKDIDGTPAASAPGQHLLVALLRGPTGQWVKPAAKGRAPVAVVAYYVGQRSTPPGSAWKEGDPLLVYAGPPAGPAPAEGLLVDYYLVNADLGREKYSIHASVTGPDLMTGKVIDSWKPWRIRGARQGSYTVRLELNRYQHDLGDSGSSTTVLLVSKPVGGRWTSVTRDFDVPPAN
jgi:hypothetical protein